MRSLATWLQKGLAKFAAVMKHRIISAAHSAAALIALAFAAHTAAAQDIASILDSIAVNNIELRALAADNEASSADLAADNSLAGLSAEYSPFWQKDVSGLAASELVVSQEMEFPTIYGARRKSARLERLAMDRRYEATLRDILLQAKLKCLELARLQEEHRVLSRRLANDGEVMRLVDRLEASGAATALDINKARMEQMSVRAAVAQNDAAQIAILADLRALNADRPVRADSIPYPVESALPPYEELRSDLMAKDADIAAARADIAAARQDVAVSRQGWLPGIRAGYRRNTSPGESMNGFIVGLSFPVWSNKSQMRAARARQTAAELRADDAELKTDNLLRSQYDRLAQLRALIDSYDAALLDNTVTLLTKAVNAGTIPVLTYYTEADLVYQKFQELNEARYQYHAILASLMRNELVQPGV